VNPTTHIINAILPTNDSMFMVVDRSVDSMLKIVIEKLRKKKQSKRNNP
jgi:hypothetical protein